MINFFDFLYYSQNIFSVFVDIAYLCLLYVCQAESQTPDLFNQDVPSTDRLSLSCLRIYSPIPIRINTYGVHNTC